VKKIHIIFDLFEKYENLLFYSLIPTHVCCCFFVYLFSHSVNSSYLFSASAVIFNQSPRPLYQSNYFHHAAGSRQGRSSAGSFRLQQLFHQSLVRKLRTQLSNNPARQTFTPFSSLSKCTATIYSTSRSQQKFVLCVCVHKVLTTNEPQLLLLHPSFLLHLLKKK
jgi:hypothetical protein